MRANGVWVGGRALRVYCRYGLREDEHGVWVLDAAGCQAQLCRADVAAHEATCEHALEARSDPPPSDIGRLWIGGHRRFP